MKKKASSQGEGGAPPASSPSVCPCGTSFSTKKNIVRILLIKVILLRVTLYGY